MDFYSPRSFLFSALFCRTVSIIAWILFLCTAKSAEPFGYGVDNFTIIGLFYLVIAPLPDAWSIDARWRRISLKSPSLQGLHRRVLQLHICIIYFFSGFAKCAGRWLVERHEFVASSDSAAF